MKIKKGALILSMKEPSATVSLAEGDEKAPQLDMIVYSGKILEDHYWWDNLALDLDGAILDKPVYPILEDHRTSRKIAFTGKPIIDGNVRIDPKKTSFVPTAESEEFQKVSLAGFPYEASIQFRPKVIEHVNEGASVEVNGYTLKGPGTVFRKWKLKEMSVATFGLDDGTYSEAFSDDQEEIEIDVEILGEDPSEHQHTTEATDKMDLTQLKKDHPDIFKEAMAEGNTAGKAEAETAFSEERTTLTTKVTDLESKISDGETALSESEKDAKEMGIRVVALEAKDKVRDDAAVKLKADGIFDEKLSESKILEKHYARVKRGVSFSDHFKEEGSGDDVKKVFDVEAFSTAVDAEIKDWEGDVTTEDVLGEGFTGNEDLSDHTSLSEVEKDEDKMVDDMFKLSGAARPPSNDE